MVARRRPDHGVGRPGPADRPGARRRARRDPRDPRAAPARGRTSPTAMGLFEAGTQGALRFEVQGIVDGVPRIVIEHVTRIDPDCAPDWPLPPDGGAGAHRVVIEGRPRIEVTLEATDEGGNRAAGGNATAANRLVNAIPWLTTAEPGLYDGLDVPLAPATRPHRKEQHRDHRRARGQGPDHLRVGRDGAGHRRRRLEVRRWPSTSTPRSACASSRPPGCGSRRSTAASSARTGAPSATARRSRTTFADAVTDWRTTPDFDDRTRLAAEYAERYALDHHGLDDEFWTRMKAHYTDREIVELSMCLGSWLAFGRLNHVLGLDAACVLPSHLSEQTARRLGLAHVGRPGVPAAGGARRPPPPGWQPPPAPARAPWPPPQWAAPQRPPPSYRAGHARRRPQARRDAAAAARAR